MALKQTTTWRLTAGIVISIITGSAAADVSFSPSRGISGQLNEDLTFRIGTRLHVDSVTFDEDVTPLQNDTDFRRARLTSRLTYQDFRLRADYDFGISEGWKSLFVEYRGLKRQRITFGNHVAPFSMEDTDSSSNLPLMERSIASALNPGLLTGISYRRWGDRWSLTGGIFGDEANELDRRIAPGHSVIARGTFAPVMEKDALVHVGFSAEQRRLNDDLRVRLRARPFSRLADSRLVDTGSIRNTDSLSNAGLEFAAAHKNYRFQAEAFRSSLDTENDDVQFNGYYMKGSVTFGARDYRYSRSRGVFRSIRPQSRWGAVEIAARYAELDLTDADITGGEQTEKTVGINWVYNRNVKLMLNHSIIEATPNRNGIDEEVNVTALRLLLQI